MKGYLTTCDGAQFELPTLLKWEFSYTGSVPCDSFTLKCAYEPCDGGGAAAGGALHGERGRHRSNLRALWTSAA